jgi:RNA polymerase sigma factor (sigma-70 family)
MGAMAVGQLSKVVQYIRSILPRQEAAEIAVDGDLLNRYVRHRDEAAFEALVRRHGPMVLGVCRRVLHNYHDAEDAFQATFLVLVRKAASLGSPNKLGNWLYGVAYRTALEARTAADKRRAKEATVVARTEAREDIWADLRPVLDQELERLPEKYRVPLVLCDLEGQTRKEVACQLGLPEGTVASRLARSRSLLAKRLVRRGSVLTVGSLETLFSESVALACVPTTLVSSTIKTVGLFAAGQGGAAGAVSAQVAALTQGVLKAMFLTKIKFATAVLLAAGFLAAGVASSGLIYQTQATVQAESRKGAQPNGNIEASKQELKAPADSVRVEQIEPSTAKAGEARPPQRNATNTKVQELLKERLATLKELSKATQKAYLQGKATFVEVAQANTLLVNAELELCKSDKERLAVHEEALGLAKESEKNADQLYKTGRATQASVLAARANRLEAEIAYERHKAKLAAPPK